MSEKQERVIRRDDYDRLFGAQALEERAFLPTADAIIAPHPAKTTWEQPGFHLGYPWFQKRDLDHP